MIFIEEKHIQGDIYLSRDEQNGYRVKRIQSRSPGKKIVGVTVHRGE